MVEAYHQLAALFNRLKLYTQGMESAREAVHREERVFGAKSLMVLSSKAQLAKALHFTQQKTEAEAVFK